MSHEMTRVFLAMMSVAFPPEDIDCASAACATPCRDDDRHPTMAGSSLNGATNGLGLRRDIGGACARMSRRLKSEW
jgi:hypothetical protein